MQVRTNHHVDAGAATPGGLDGYCYEYDLTVFSTAGSSLVARSYTTTPHEVHFLRIEVNSHHRRLTDHDVKTKLFVEAVAYLRRAGKTEVNWLSGRGSGYEPIPCES